MEILKGTVKRKIYCSTDGNYIVLEIETEASDNTIIISGDMGNIGIGNNIRIKGSWINHKKYGRQFKVEQYEEIPPSTLKGRAEIIVYEEEKYI